MRFSILALTLCLSFVFSCKENSKSPTENPPDYPENAIYSVVGDWVNQTVPSDKISFSERGTVNNVELGVENGNSTKEKESYTIKDNQLQIIRVKEVYDYDSGNAKLDLFERDTTNYVIKWIQPRQFELKLITPTDTLSRVYNLVE